MATTLTLTYNPFTYEELLAPTLQMTEEHRKVEEGLGQLKAQAAKWQQLANAETDPIAHAQYQRFANDLVIQATALSNRGITTSSRQQLYDMSGRYQSEIVPIEEAHKRREEQVKMQLQASASNPSLIFSRSAQNTSLDDYMDNPALSYQQISGEYVTQQAYNAFKSLANKINDTKLSDLGDFYQYRVSKGVTPSEVMKVVLGDPSADPKLVEIIENTVDLTGVRGWNSPEALEQVYAAARQGAWGAVGGEESNITTDWRDQENLQFSHSKSLQADSQAFQETQADKAYARQFVAVNGATDTEYNLPIYIDQNGRYGVFSNGKFIARDYGAATTDLNKALGASYGQEQYVKTDRENANTKEKIYYNTKDGTYGYLRSGKFVEGKFTNPEEFDDWRKNSSKVKLRSYGGSLNIPNKVNLFSEGGSMQGDSYSGIQVRMQNLNQYEQAYIDEEKERLKKLGTAGLAEYRHGYTPAEWDIYLGKDVTPQPTAKEIRDSNKAKGRANIDYFVMDSFWDDTSGGLEAGRVGALSEDDNSMYLIYDGGTKYENGTSINMSEKFFQDLDTRLSELEYEYEDVDGAIKKAKLNKADIRIYVDPDPASDNHFLIVTKENDPFAKGDANYTKRLANPQTLDGILNNKNINSNGADTDSNASGYGGL